VSVLCPRSGAWIDNASSCHVRSRRRVLRALSSCAGKASRIGASVCARLEPLHRPIWCLTALLCAAALASCGGEGEESAPGPTLPSGLASDLASRSDAIADAHAAGDVCGAARQADDLLDAVIAAIEEGRVPADFQEPLTATANELVNEINCPEQKPAPPAEASDCGGLVEQKDALEEEKKDTEGRDRELEDRIKALEEQIEACQEAGDERDGDEEEDD